MTLNDAYGGTVSLTVHATVLDALDGERVPELRAYAFGSSGALLGSADLADGAGSVEIRTGAEPDQLRVLVGPKVTTEDEGELLATLVRVRAAESMVGPADLSEQITLPIDRAVWPCWLTFCTVRGTLLKHVVSGGIPMDLPVCDAEVEIYEVEPLRMVVPRIPDWILELLRTIIVQPWPGPGPDPGPLLAASRAAVPASAFRVAGTAVAASAAQHVSDEHLTGGVRPFVFSSEEQTVPSTEEARAALQAVVAEPALVRAAKAGVSALRDELIAQPDVTRSLLCFLWPPAVTTQLVATVTTDECGHFRARLWHGCTGENPNYYFKAFRTIGFWRFPIYTPTPVGCNTWWNYACGSEVTLRTTSPFAVGCPPCPPVIAPRHWVLAMAIGNTSLASVHGVGSDLTATTDASNMGLTSWGAPWANNLRVRLEFDNTLRTDLNVRYYRMSWRKAGSANPFVDLTADQSRHYAHWVGSTLVIDQYRLGPQLVGTTTSLFEIPPGLPPAGQWVIADTVVDTSNATFEATLAPPAEAGLYEFKLDLFDSTGHQVDATTLGISYRIPSTTDLTSTITTDDAAALGLVTADGSLVFQLRVDNNPCAGSIGAAALGSQTVGADCGVLHYTPPASGAVSLPFTATHPNGFATYYFQVLRGLTQVFAENNPVGAPPGSHDPSPSVGTLLGSCMTAGFAEDLYVYATATDGWSRQWQLDSHPNPRPFVLTPGP